MNYARSVMDIVGIERRNGKNKNVQNQLKKGIIPSNDMEHESIRLQMLKGTFKNADVGKSVYNKTKYRFMLEAKFDIANHCCRVVKKNPTHLYFKKTGRTPITAQMADESKLRKQKWIEHGCNGFDLKIPTSNPMSFWTENDVLEYIYLHHLPICSVYGDVVIDYGHDNQVDGQMSIYDYEGFEDGLRQTHYKTTGCKRTGCVLCGFGAHLEKPGEGRFEMLKKTHPKMYKLLDVVENNGVTYREAIDWVNEHGNMNIRY